MPCSSTTSGASRSSGPARATWNRAPFAATKRCSQGPSRRSAAESTVLIGANLPARRDSLLTRVEAVPLQERERAEDGGERRGDDDRDDDVLVLLAAGPERELADEERHGEPDAAEETDGADVAPPQARRQGRVGEPGDQPRGPEDAE